MANPKSTKMWIEKARMDLRVAKHLRPIEEDFFSGIVFHAQQCAEKAIKGFLTFHNIRVLKTHNMKKLLESLSLVDTGLANQFSELEVFTLYAVEYRYPDAELKLPPLTEDVANEAVKLAESVLNQLSAKIDLAK